MNSFDLCSSGDFPRENWEDGWLRRACQPAFISGGDLVWLQNLNLQAQLCDPTGGNKTHRRTLWRSVKDNFKHAKGTDSALALSHTHTHTCRPNSKYLIETGRKQRTSRACCFALRLCSTPLLSAANVLITHSILSSSC